MKDPDTLRVSSREIAALAAARAVEKPPPGGSLERKLMASHNFLQPSLPYDINADSYETVFGAKRQVEDVA